MKKSLCLALCLIAVRLIGQERFGVLNGTVSDDTGAVLPGVTVTLTHSTTRRTIVASTRADGGYSVRNLDPGRYSIKFELARFATREFDEIDILTGQTLRLDAKMAVAGVRTSVQVTDAIPLIDTESAIATHSVPQQEIEGLPKSRTFQSFAVMAPGVNTGEIEGGIQVNGASGAENTFVVDGVATESAIDGTSRQNAAPEYIEEIQIKTSGIEAEYRGSLGGAISATTKSGGDAFHGEAWFYFDGAPLSASPAQRLTLDPQNNRSAAYYQDDKGLNNRFEPGFSLGGPIRKDVLYFFTSWSPRKTHEEQTFGFSNGSEKSPLERDRTFWSGFNKLSFNPTSRIRTNLSWLWTPTKSNGAFPAFDGSCPNCISSTKAANAVYPSLGFFAPQSSTAGVVDFLLTNNVVITARGGYFWDNYKDSGIPNITSVQYQNPASGPLVPPPLRGPAGTQNTPALLNTRHDLIARSNGQIGVDVTGELAGYHSLKAAFEAEKTVNDVDRYYPGGYVQIFWDLPYTSPVTQKTDRGTYGYYAVNDFRVAGATGATTQSAYVQDHWRVHSRLTLDPGVRIEHERIPSFRRDIQKTAFEFPWSEKIAPRIGAAFDAFGDGKFKIYGSWGRSYDWTKFRLARETFGAEIWRTYYRSLDTTDVFSLSLSNMPGRDLFNPAVPGSFLDQRNPAAGLKSVDPNLKPMSQDQWSAGADYQWSRNTVLGARYIHQHLRRAVDDLAAKVSGQFAYIFANPGEGLAEAVPFASGRTALPLPYPKPVRNYDAVEITAKKRFSDHWFANLSYTWSRLYGNYAGLASSDEIRTPTTGVSYATAQQASGSAASPASYTNRGWDLDEILFDAKGNFDPKGPLATDRPHVLKVNGGYEFNRTRFGATSVGGFFYLGSGTPVSTVVNTTNNLAVFVNGRGDLGRTPALNNTDFQVAHRLNLTERQTLRFEINVLNAFNQKTARHRFDNLNRGAGVAVSSSAINLANTDLRAGYDYNALIRATPDGANGFDPRYGKDDLFSSGFAARLGVKWVF